MKTLKRLLAPLVLSVAAISAHAEQGGVLMYIPNTGGGNIELTNIVCPDDPNGWIALALNGYHAYTRTYSRGSFVKTPYGAVDTNWRTVH